MICNNNLSIVFLSIFFLLMAAGVMLEKSIVAEVKKKRDIFARANVQVAFVSMPNDDTGHAWGMLCSFILKRQYRKVPDRKVVALGDMMFCTLILDLLGLGAALFVMTFSAGCPNQIPRWSVGLG